MVDIIVDTVAGANASTFGEEILSSLILDKMIVLEESTRFRDGSNRFLKTCLPLRDTGVSLDAKIGVIVGGKEKLLPRSPVSIDIRWRLACMIGADC